VFDFVTRRKPPGFKCFHDRADLVVADCRLMEGNEISVHKYAPET